MENRTEIFEFTMDSLEEALELSDVLFKELGLTKKSIATLKKDISPMIDEEGMYFILTVYRLEDYDQI